ncbi:MAG: bacteriohemerythrin [Desulfuromonadaceae bacterium]|nr:bacteriohemerythrin [Desulfuromonadaceae bacterium]
MRWDTSFELGIHEFDEHHKHLVNLLNMTYDGFCFGADFDEREAVLDELVNYAHYHFTAEEYWMGVHHYPELALHREEHNKFSARVAEIQHDFLSSNANLSLEILLFLQDWLVIHILKSDADYGRFAKGLPHTTQ